MWHASASAASAALTLLILAVIEEICHADHTPMTEKDMTTSLSALNSALRARLRASRFSLDGLDLMPTP